MAEGKRAERAGTTSQLDLVTEVLPSHLTTGVYSRAVLDQGRRFTRSLHWITEPDGLSKLSSLEVVLLQHDEQGNGSATLLVDGCLAKVGLRAGNVWVDLAGERDHLDQAEATLRELLPESSLEPNEVSMSFWWLTDHGARSRRRLVEVARWSDIGVNYPQGVRGELDELMALDEPTESGRLILWHGSPGAGKTWCLRALAKEWESWCDFDYISDPERFFGKAEYMIEVLLDGASLRTRPRWRLLILEDTGELLAADAKERSGQGLSRFLNTVDGLIGQGLKTLILVTTNEKINRLHPAVVRSGRCQASVNFTTFTADEAAAWLHRHGKHDIEVHRAMTLSDLYAASRGQSSPVPCRSTGFIAPAAASSAR